MSFDLVQREVTADELRVLASHGRVTSVALVRAMARRAGGDSALVEIKAVDQSYPTGGTLSLHPAQSLADAFELRNGA